MLSLSASQLEKLKGKYQNLRKSVVFKIDRLKSVVNVHLTSFTSKRYNSFTKAIEEEVNKCMYTVSMKALMQKSTCL